MNLIRLAVNSRLLVVAGLLATAPQLFAQSSEDESERRGAGLRVGIWSAEDPAIPGTTFERTPHAAIYFERGLDEHIALESSIAGWRRTATRTELSGNQVETHTYIFPLFTALRIYAVTTRDDLFEPFISGGIGFALGIDDVGSNAIGGGGTTIVTGFGFQGAVGIDLNVTGSFGLQASARYQWLRFGEPLGGSDLYKGFGVEGGLTYRVQF